MQTTVYQAEVRRAIEEQGVKPENPQRIYRLNLQADTEADFTALAEILEWLKRRAKRQGAPVIEEEGSRLPEKAEAAKNN